MDGGRLILLYFSPLIEQASTLALQETTSPTLGPVVLPNPFDLVFQIESCDTTIGDVIAKEENRPSLITPSEGDLFSLALLMVHTSLSLDVSLAFLSSMEEPSSALRDASEVAIITTCVSSAALRLQIPRWFFQIVWDIRLLELPQLRFDGLLRSFFMQEVLQGILYLYNAMVTSSLPIAQLTSMADDLAQDYYGTHCLVPRSLHSLDFPRLLVQVHMAHLVFQIW